jgi:short-subunit dehydrogenase
VYVARAVLPAMLARGEGYLVITASAAGLLTQLGSAPYAVTKHAAVAFAEWLSITYADQGLRVSCLCPQAFSSNLLDTSRREAGADALPETSQAGPSAQAAVDGVLTADEVARAALDAIGTEQFLVLPHPEVATYEQRRADDRERWLRGMRRMQARLAADSGERGLD